MYLTHHFSAFLTSVSASMTINEVFIVILTLVIYFRILDPVFCQHLSTCISL